MQARVAGLWGRAVDAVLPPRCAVSGEIVDQQGILAPVAWAGLDFIAEPMCAACGLPFGFLVEPGSLCAGCIAEAPPFRAARAVLVYNEASRAVILGFKHGDQTHAVRSFVPWLNRAGAALLAQAEIVAPVPLHRWRFMARRYNQAALISAGLSKLNKLKHIPDLLVRTRATPSQGYRKEAERFKNVRGAFAVQERYLDVIKGKKILLVDDVYTTGATVQECAKALMKAGAAQVYVLTLARVVKGGFG